MSETPDFDLAMKISFEQLEKHNRNRAKLPIELVTIITITTVQGIIDNGGLVYLFERDFEGQPTYDSFADPHLDQDKRIECMENWGEQKGIKIDLLWPWDSQDVWSLANGYAKTHRTIFKNF